MLKKILIAGFVVCSTISLSGQSYGGRLISIKDTITDKDLVIPEDIERNFDQLLIDWKKDLKRSTSCNSNYDTDISYPDSVYINRLYSLPTEMELAYNPIVRSYIDMYTGRRRSSVEYFLGKKNYYFPIFEQALDKYGLPLELKYLPIIESALNPTIASHAGATGLWQFMIGTGKMYNLEINSLVDERRDPLKSTDAAARYLRDLFNIYGDWNLVIAAYNCGPGNVNKAIRRSGGQTDYWTIYQYLPRETRGYVPAFIAATYVMNYYGSHNICPSEYQYTHSTDTIEVDKYLHLQQLSDILNVPIEKIRELNPQYKKDIVPGEFKRYLVTLPSTPAADFAIYKDSVYTYRSQDFLAHRKIVDPNGGTGSGSTTTSSVRHKVRRGETLASIASKHKVTTTQVRRWNRLKSNKLRVGQVLAINKTVKVKGMDDTATAVASQTYAANLTSASATNISEPSYNNEGVSDMLAEYFEKQSLGASNTVVANNLSAPATVEDMVDAGEEINKNNEESRIPDEARTIYHKVRIGETLSIIATKYNVSNKEISSWNKLKSSVPKIGQRLVIHLPTNPPKTDEELIAENESLSAPADNLLAEQVATSNKISFNQYRESVPMASVDANAEVIRKPSSSEKAVSTKKTRKEQTNKTKKQSVYTVKKGDTLGHIVMKLGGKVSTSDIMKANRLSSDKLKVGQKLRIPR